MGGYEWMVHVAWTICMDGSRNVLVQAGRSLVAVFWRRGYDGSAIHGIFLLELVAFFQRFFL